MGTVRLKEVAAAAGVSEFTVSCALRGSGRVAAGTAARIRVLAAELGYEPSAAGRLLAAGRRRARGAAGRPVLALVQLGERRPGRPERIARGQSARLGALARAAGYDLEEAWLGDYASPAHLGRVLWARGVRGLILRTSTAPAGFGAGDLAGLGLERFALVKISRGVDGLHCHAVRSSAFSETRLALERIVAAGYRRIGVLLLATSASNEDDWARLGALRAFESLGQMERVECLEILRTEALGPILPAAVRDWLERVRPEVVLGFPVAWRVWMEDAGYRVPADLAFVGVPVVRPEEAETGVATSGPLLDFVGQEFPAALRLLQEELAAGRRGLPALPAEHVLAPVWQDGVTMPGVGR